MTRGPLAAPLARWALAAFIAVVLLLGGQPREAAADRTQLLKVNLRTGKKTSIDKKGPKSAVDKELDALLDSSTGKTFSTADLGKVEAAVRRYLRSTRPRAMPRLLLFLYPGSITTSRLKELREVLIDIDLVVDPCGRTVCRDAVATHLEIIGKALKQAVIRTKDYLIRFKNVTVRTATSMGGTQYDIYSFRAEEVVRAGKSGGGQKLVRRVQSAAEGYGRQMAKATARALRVRRVRPSKTPRIQRQAGSVTVELELRSDRVRYKRHVLDALLATMGVLRKSKLTPETVKFTIVALVPRRGVERKLFRCSGKPVVQVLQGKLTKSELWTSYVSEQRKDVRQLSFSDGEARGGSLSSDRGPDQSGQILARHMSLLAPCLQGEAKRDRRFAGVTLVFSVDGKGRAVQLRTKERSSAKLQRCLRGALRQIAFQRHGGAPRAVTYPMFIKR